MSIEKFTGAMRDKALDTLSSTTVSEIQSAQLRLLRESTRLYDSRNTMLRSASIINTDADALRKRGEKQGRTRLVLTGDNISLIVRTYVNLASSVTSSDILMYYLEYVNKYHTKLKARHFEIYTSEGRVQISPNASFEELKNAAAATGKEIIAVRGINFSHENALKHMALFLMHLGAFSGVSLDAAKKQISANFERGHVYATTTIRQINSIGGINDKAPTFLDELAKLSMDLDKASSSLKNPIYAELDAAIQKDFSGSGLFMNIEFQPRFSKDGTGNQDTGRIAGGLQIISTMVKLLDNLSYSRSGSLISTPTILNNIKPVLKNLENMLVKLNKQAKNIEKVLTGYVDNPEQYVLDLKSSDTLKQYLGKHLKSILKTGKDLDPLKIKHPKKPVYQNSVLEKNIDANVKKLTNSIRAAKASLPKNPTVNIPKVRTTTGQFYSLASLQVLMDSVLSEVVEENMGNGRRRDILNLQSGRFAQSVKVEKISQSRQGMISIFYTYMKNPYQTFEPGYRQGFPLSRDPKLLISKSIREIAATKVSNRLRAVRV